MAWDRCSSAQLGVPPTVLGCLSQRKGGCGVSEAVGEVSLEGGHLGGLRGGQNSREPTQGWHVALLRKCLASGV